MSTTRRMLQQQRRANMDMEQDLKEQLYSMTSRLRLNFRSTSCIAQSFPYVLNQLREENLLLELQEVILTHLPALKLLELRAVCRSWRNLLQSSSFKEKWQLMRGGRNYEMLDVWVMQSKQEDLIAYVPALDKYFLFLSLISSFFVMAQPAFNFKINEISFICACGSAFVLAKKDWRSHPVFFMINSYSWHRHPVAELQLQNGGSNEVYSILPSSFPVLIHDMDRRSLPFLAVETQCVSENGSCPVYELRIFSFATRTWTSFPQSSATQADLSDMNAVLCGSFFRYDQEESTLYAWSIPHWSKVQVTFADGVLPSHEIQHNTEANAFKVVKCEGHILLITSTVQWEGRVGAQCFTIWKLMKGAEESATWNWFEISRTPPEFCLKGFVQESFVHPTAVCDGCHICITLSSPEFFPPLVYDVKNGSWYQLHGVWKDMQALFAMKLGMKIDVL